MRTVKRWITIGQDQKGHHIQEVQLVPEIGEYFRAHRVLEGTQIGDKRTIDPNIAYYSNWQVGDNYDDQDDVEPDDVLSYWAYMQEHHPKKWRKMEGF